MKYCTNCGKELADDMRFCPGCGHDSVLDQNINNFYSAPPKDDSDKTSISFPLIFNGIIAFIIGAICAIIANTIDVNGFVRAYDDTYDTLCENVFRASSVFFAMVFIGIIMIVVGIVAKYVQQIPKVEKNIYNLLLILPAGLILLFTLIFLIPIIQFYTY